jgi:integrase
MKWHVEFIDAPVVDARKQRTPALNTEEVTKIVAVIEAEMRMQFILAAAMGLRASEVLGAEIRHFDGRRVKIGQSVWRSNAQTRKTQNGYRIVELRPDVTTMLWDFVDGHTSAYIFGTRSGKPSVNATSCAGTCTRLWQVSG